MIDAPVLAGERISMRYRGLVALDEVDIALRPGTATGLIGPNGAGKTTLVNVLSGLAVPTSGRVLLDGTEVRRWSLSTAARSGVARTFQASRVFRDRLVVDNVTVSPVHRRLDFDPLEIVDLGSRRFDRAGTLSYGELRRLGVAIALSTGPRVLLLDEPGAGLTGPDLTQLGSAIRRIVETGCTVLLVDHNMRFLMQTVERVVMLESGRLLADGTPQEIQADERVRSAYLGSHT